MKYTFAGVLSGLYFFSTGRIGIGIIAVGAGILADILEDK